jgi:hypothetical protein
VECAKSEGKRYAHVQFQDAGEAAAAMAAMIGTLVGWLDFSATSSSQGFARVVVLHLQHASQPSIQPRLAAPLPRIA